MANPFDQFDTGAGNAFDKFDAAPAKKAAAKAPEKEYGFFGNAVGAVAEPIAAMASGAVAKPVSEVMGLSALGREAFPGAPGGDPRAFQQDVQRSLTYEPKTPAGRSGANPLNLIPQLLGKLVGAAGQGAGNIVAPPGSGPMREAVGRGVTEAVEQAPGFLGAKAPGTTAAIGKGMAQGERWGARGLMQSALKPGEVAQRTGKSDKAISTLLKEGINVSPGGMEKLEAKVTAINDQIAERIKASGAMIDKTAVGDTMKDAFDRFKKQVTPQSDLATIERAWNQFMDHPFLPKITPAKTVESKLVDERGVPFKKEIPASGSNLFPVQQAQEMKQGTYRALKDKAYGELQGADKEAQKALARGLKEEIAKAVPEVRTLNAQESQLLNALSLVERRVLKEANKNPIGLGILSMKPSHLAVWLADRSPLFKSLVARMLNSAAPAVAASGQFGAPLGMALTSQAQTPPMPPQ